VFESPGRPKVTDLNAVEPDVAWEDGALLIKAAINTSLGLVEKQWRIDEINGHVTLSYCLHWRDVDLGSLRLGYLTLNPKAFAPDTLCYQTHNGGRDLESLSLAQSDFDHGAPVSCLISANQALGLTEGQLLIGDARSAIDVKLEKIKHAGIGLMSYRRINGSYLCRFVVTLKELDDTSRSRNGDGFYFEITLTPLKVLISQTN
jgi:hypothetical protein